MRPEASRVRRGLLALLNLEWLGRPDGRRGLIRPPLDPGQNPGSETREKLVFLHGLSLSIRDCSEGNDYEPSHARDVTHRCDMKHAAAECGVRPPAALLSGVVAPKVTLRAGLDWSSLPGARTD